MQDRNFSVKNLFTFLKAHQLLPDIFVISSNLYIFSSKTGENVQLSNINVL